MLILLAALCLQVVEEPKLTFDLEKVQQVYDNYTVNYHAGLTMVMGHPFRDATFLQYIISEQNAIKDVFALFHLDDILILYNPQYQIHATLIELASQHDKKRNDQRFLNEEELHFQAKQKI